METVNTLQTTFSRHKGSILNKIKFSYKNFRLILGYNRQITIYLNLIDVPTPFAAKSLISTYEPNA